MRKLLLNLHLYLALFIGIFVVIIGVTGSVMAFEEEIDHLTHPQFFKVQPQGNPLPVVDLLKAASAAYPGQRIGNLRLPQNPDDSATFGVKGPKQVALDPYTGKVVAERSPGTVLSTIHQIHLRLLLGPPGAAVVASVTGVLLFLVVSGIYLWWPLKRVKVKWGASARRIHFDLHNTAGIYSAAFLFVLGVTGIVIHFDNDLESYLHQKAGTAKIVKNTPSVVQAGVTPITPDQAVRIALDAMPGTKALNVASPANPKASYLIGLRYPEDLTPGGRSWANVDQYSGKVVNSQNSRTVAAGTRTIITNRAIHTGDIFGFFSKLLMSLSCLMLITQAITGYYMWWKKMRVKQNQVETAEIVAS
jgi:uncharacterized iron-regulated membrane protein